MVYTVMLLNTQFAKEQILELKKEPDLDFVDYCLDRLYDKIEFSIRAKQNLKYANIRTAENNIVKAILLEDRPPQNANQAVEVIKLKNNLHVAYYIDRAA